MRRGPLLPSQDRNWGEADVGSVKKSGSIRAALAVGVVAVAAVAGACAPNPVEPTTTTSTIPWETPVGQWTGFTMSCEADVFGTKYPFGQAASVNLNTPSTVAQGETFTMVVAPGPFVIPTNVSGYDLSAMSDITIRFPLSPNLTWVDGVMSASTNTGTGYPSIGFDGTDVVYKVPGPFTPGTTVQMPLVKLKVTASGPVGSTAEVRMRSLSATATVAIIGVQSVCTPPNQVYGTTAITGAAAR